MGNYYAERLGALKLYRVYETEYPRVQQYLNAEVAFVADGLTGSERVLEVGAGYGRILKQLANRARELTGIDIAQDSVDYAEKYLEANANCRVINMDARAIRFDERFDVVLALQNAISAIKSQPMELVRQCMQALAPGGRGYFSTYSSKFWAHRMLWFREQVDKGLLGELDMEKTHDGVIVCKDGFTAVTFSEEDLQRLGEASGYAYSIHEVDESSLFLVLTKD